MRSLKVERKPRRSPRGKTSRRGTASPRAAAQPMAFGKRKRNDSLSLFVARVRGWFAFGRPMLWLTGLLMIVTLVGALFAGGYVKGAFAAARQSGDSFVADAGFGISSVHLAGNRRTQPDAILTALGFEPGQSIFGADVQAARAHLLALDWVADAEVRRQYPDSISVSIVEKVPFALWQATNGIYVVERSGRTIAAVDAAQFPHLPFLIGEGAPEAAAPLIDAVASHRAVRARLKAMQRVSMRRWNLVLDDGVIVELPEDGWAEQLGALEHLIVDKGVLERDISEIDLRARDNYFFVTRNGQKQETARGNAA